MGILRIVSGHTLPCGCLVGVYEKYSGEIVEIVDSPDASCPEPAHRTGAEIGRRDTPVAPGRVTGR